MNFHRRHLNWLHNWLLKTRRLSNTLKGSLNNPRLLAGQYFKVTEYTLSSVVFLIFLRTRVPTFKPYVIYLSFSKSFSNPKLSEKPPPGSNIYFSGSMTLWNAVHRRSSRHLSPYRSGHPYRDDWGRPYSPGIDSPGRYHHDGQRSRSRSRSRTRYGRHEEHMHRFGRSPPSTISGSLLMGQKQLFETSTYLICHQCCESGLDLDLVVLDS